MVLHPATGAGKRARPGPGVNLRSVLDRLDVEKGSSPEGASRSSTLRSLLLGLSLLALVAGIACWALDFGIVAMWLFVAAAVGVALVLPLPHAFVSPLYMSLFAWLVNMVPLALLAAWTAVSLRWALGLLKERRLPRGGRWIWLPVALAAWTALGVLVVSSFDMKRFLLLFGIQVVSSATMLAVVDSMASLRDRMTIVWGLLGFVVLLSVAVLAQWVGINIQALQDTSVAARAEAAYGLDAFPNNIGMIKYARAQEGGAPAFRGKLEALARETPGLPAFEVFRPGFKAFDTDLVVRFDGSAREFEEQLAPLDIELIYDNVGLAPGAGVPRLRSFPRNALTYAGVSAALFPLGFFFAWWRRDRSRWFGVLAVASCLFGAGFSLARGSWAAILIGVIYLLVDGVMDRRAKMGAAAAFLAGALVLMGVFVFRYNSDPLNARAGAEGSVTTRQNVYTETVDSVVQGIHIVLGYGTERPRSDTGTSHVGTQYIPNAGTHSTYLNYAFRTGIPGALAVIVLYAIAILHSRARSRRERDDEGLFSSLVTASVIIAAAHAVILSLYVEPIYTLTISLLLGIAMAGVGSFRGSLLPWKRPAAVDGS